MPPSASPHPLGRLLKDLFHSKNWEKRLEQHAVFLSWEEIVGEEIAAQAQPDCIRGNVLWLRVSDSIWMQQLQFQKMVLLEAIDGRLGGKKITDIRFRLDAAGTLRSAVGPRKEKRRHQPVSQAEQRRFEQVVGRAGDGELQEILCRLWVKSRRARRN